MADNSTIAVGIVAAAVPTVTGIVAIVLQQNGLKALEAKMDRRFDYLMDHLFKLSERMAVVETKQQ